VKKIAKYFIRTLIFLPLFFIYSTKIENSENDKKIQVIDPPFVGYYSNWTDSVFASMTPDERLGQLFMIAAYPKQGKEHVDNLKKLIDKYKVGGIIMFQSGPVAQAKLTNYCQSISKTPLMIAGDYEWGLSMRMDSTQAFPRQMAFGAIQNEKLIYEFGVEIARQFKRLGININFAPVIDVNNNADNPVINSRSFGEERENVARKGFAYMLGLQDNKILATGKHFPGHGDTDVDSHKDLPIIKHSKSRLDSIELYPFKELINNGLAGVMVGHLNIPSLDSANNSISSLSKKIITDLLIKKLKFKGLIFTDALGMQGVAKSFPAGVVDVKALIAGSDILLMSKDVPQAFIEIKKAIANGEITQDEIDLRCKKILKAKNWMGLDKYKPIELKNLYNDLNSKEAELIQRKLVEASLTLVFNKNNLIPFKKLNNVKIAGVSIGTGNQTEFLSRLNSYGKVDENKIFKDSDTTTFNNLLFNLKNYDEIIVGIQATSQNPKFFGITPQTLEFVDKLSKTKSVTLVIFGNPYSVSLFKNIDKLQALLVTYDDKNITQDLAAQLLFGGIPAKGKLPVSVGSSLKVGTGIDTEKNRLKYSIPEELKIKTEKLQKVDSILLKAIGDGAMPGVTVMAIKDGVVFYYKSFGFHTYDNLEPTLNSDIYDLASLTKVTATTPSIMRLVDEKKIDINKKLSDYLPELNETNKKYLNFKDVMTHQARLSSWIPFYLRTYSEKKNYELRKDIYSTIKSDSFPYQVADNLYIAKFYEDTIFKRIYNTKLSRKKHYRYSDLGFFLLYRTIEHITNEPLEQYTSEYFYQPLGAVTTGYKPRNRFSKQEIVPTEQDTKFRKQLLQGYVHDYGAALTDGVGGHAGLFSNANDLAKLFEMYLEGGEYGGVRYLNKETLNIFTSSIFDCTGNRRGLGFDKNTPNGKGSACELVSEQSYGHTGFTGTMFWIDPKYDFIYIFLSNRINPSIENNKLHEQAIRTKVQRVFYESFLSQKKGV